MSAVGKDELRSVAQTVLDQLPRKNSATILALAGDLGAGKTTFTQALAREMGVEEVVQSPTYVLMKKYATTHPYFTTLIHIDAYRLEEPLQFSALRPEEFLGDPHTLVCIEWPERLEGVLPKPDMVLKFSADPPAGEAGAANEGKRYIEGYE
ncbi:MAG TPA: tRNA (adenosine(37)-N6)-threonylcarbamoyltransferase complex ATPase subunit type 1 TsaE [Candidatus Paceibacterota bacterium]|nr:tRNA (adenosine(37)-N6)-threonylcarbamoyltransferase complex ATPase subunit type 1 TsaE [Candidatus Paceibacterota bacterium]